MRICIIFVTSISLAGCGTVFDPAQLLPSSSQTVLDRLKAQRTSEETLIAEFQHENETLKFLSRGQYECGDPKLLRNLLKTDPAAYVKQEKIDEKFAAGEAYVGKYLAAMKAVISENKDAQQEIEDIAGIANAAAVLGVAFGATSSISSGVKALKDLAKTGVNEFNLFQLRQVAHDMNRGLHTAVGALKKYYPTFAENEKRLFRVWDQCAVEKLVFIRDIPIQKVDGYEQRVTFGSNSGVELEVAYKAYLERRKELKGTAFAEAVFDKILEENAALLNPDLTLASVRATIEHMNSINESVQTVKKEAPKLFAQR